MMDQNSLPKALRSAPKVTHHSARALDRGRISEETEAHRPALSARLFDFEYDQDDERTTVFVRPAGRRAGAVVQAPTASRSENRASRIPRSLDSRELRATRGARGRSPILVAPSNSTLHSAGDVAQEDIDGARNQTDRSGSELGAARREAEEGLADGVPSFTNEIAPDEHLDARAPIDPAPRARHVGRRLQRAMLPMVCLVAAAIGFVAWNVEASASPRNATTSKVAASALVEPTATAALPTNPPESASSVAAVEDAPVRCMKETSREGVPSADVPQATDVEKATDGQPAADVQQATEAETSPAVASAPTVEVRSATRAVRRMPPVARQASAKREAVRPRAAAASSDSEALERALAARLGH